MDISDPWGIKGWWETTHQEKLEVPDLTPRREPQALAKGENTSQG